MPKSDKPTGAELYKRFMKGESFFLISYSLHFDLTDKMVENAIRAYLKRRDARRKAK